MRSKIGPIKIAIVTSIFVVGVIAPLTLPLFGLFGCVSACLGHDGLKYLEIPLFIFDIKTVVDFIVES